LRIARAYNPTTNSPRYSFESKVAEAVIDNWLTEKNVRQLRGKRISETPGAVAKQNGRITSFVLENGDRVAGRVFIDGTVEGDLMTFAGVTNTHGREGNAAYGENVGGIIDPTLKNQFTVPIDPYKIPGDPSSGVITGVQDEEVGNHGGGDDAAMGFCLRLPLTKNPANKIPITAPPGYKAEDYEIYKRFLAAGGTNDWLDGPSSVNTSTTQKIFDLGSWHDLSANLYGRNKAYATGSYAVRDQIYQEHKNYTQGLIHFLSTDPSVPQSIRDEWSRWGLPADEFTDNGGWPRRLYVRCARRMISDYVITEADVRRTATGSVTPRPAVNDSIGICYWPVDLHNARTVIRNGKVHNEGAYFDLANYKPFGIPYRSIVPKRNDCTNLLVPSALSSSYAGYGAVRLEWTFMVLGQSAAIAAAIAADQNLAIQDVPYDHLRTLMLSRGQRLSLNNGADSGTIVDNAEAQTTGSWTTSTLISGYIGSNYFHDGNAGKGTKTIRYTPTLPSSGKYKVYARWNSDSFRANNAPFTITHAGGTENLTINQRENGNQWNLIGEWNFNAGTSGNVLISNAGTNGYVIADAVSFVAETTKPVVGIAAVRSTIREASAERVRFVVHRSGDTTNPLTIPIQLQGTATAGADYTPSPTSIVIPAGSSSAELSLTPVTDEIPETAEILSVTIPSDNSYTLGSANAVVTILDRPYQHWHATKLASSGASAPLDDPDVDGNKNLLEFALGGDPGKSDIHETVAETVVLKTNGEPFMDFNFWRNRDLGTGTLAVKISHDMKTWTDAPSPGETRAYDPVTDRIQIHHRFPVESGKPSLFVRLLATGP
ncbi:MAG TPA: FAD-dependent oxidoreductase, partial [Luteolibacter sp.]|nr:FAD-dependent oxidoreductase [Luteolibacter sp.]